MTLLMKIVKCTQSIDINRQLRRLVLLSLALLIGLLTPIQTVAAIDKDLKKYLDSHVLYFDPDCSPPESAHSSTEAGLAGQVSPVYILGDSITSGAKKDIENAFKEAGLEISKINADPGRAISKDTVGNDPTGLEAAAADKGKIGLSASVVVALGTNSGVEDLDEQIPLLVQEIRKGKTDIPIYWVNVFSEGGVKKTSINKSISGQATNNNYTIIDTNTGTKITTGDDSIHPDAAGSKTFAEKIAAKLAAEKAKASAGTGTNATKVSAAASIGDEMPGKTDVEKVYNRLIKLGLAPKGAAGVVGNNVFESGSADPAVPPPEKLDTRASNGNHTGIAQWDNARWAKLVEFANGASPYKLSVQANYIYHELETDYGSSLAKLNSAASPSAAAKIFSDEIERPESYDPQRGEAAEVIFKRYGEGGGTQTGGGNPAVEDSGRDGVCCIDGSNGGNAVASAGSASGDRKNYMYHSGLPGADGSGSGEFILEQWAIHTLKSIAKLKGVSESDTVTENHVVALVAFALGEGGDINNQWKFNPLNSGHPSDLYVDGAHAGNGTQSFKSFDAGVSATSRHMTEGYQTRLGDVLIKPNSTPTDFFKALVAPEKTSGNLHWAEAANPSSPYYESNYYPTRLNLVRQVKAGYKDIASYTIGTPNFKDQPNNARKPELLQFGDVSGVSEGEGGMEVAGATQCCGDQSAGGAAGFTASEPSSWKQIYKTDKAISDKMDNGKFDKIDTLVIHYTQGSSEGKDMLADMANRGVGIQFNIGKTGTIYQVFPLNDMRKTGHVGSANSEAIGIEITGNNATEILANEAQFKAVAELSTFLCDTYDIPCGQPQGKITGAELAQTQGMIGHDETPGNDHVDPDYNPGATIDNDSSKHPYMKKLRTAMGFEPEPSKDKPGSGSPTTEPIGNGNGGCVDPSTSSTGNAEMQKTITVKEGGEFITLPSRYSCPGRTTKIDARIAASLAYILTKYNLCADDGLANNHRSHGAGLGVDVRPKDQSKQNSKDEWKNTAEAAVRDMNWWGDAATEGKTSKGCATYTSRDSPSKGYGQCVGGAEGPSGKIPKWVRWIGYNGDIDHGDPWHVYGGSYGHIHLGWDTPNNDGVSGTIIANPVPEVYTFPAPVPEDLKALLPATLKDGPTQ